MSEVDIESRLQQLGIMLPTPPVAVANYMPWLICDGMLYISGQLPLGSNGLIATGRLGAGVSLEQGVLAARHCAINILAQARAATGSLNTIRRLVALRVFVASTTDFYQHPMIANGASDLLVEVFGERGRHVRSAIGVAVLPLDAPVEIEAQLAV